MMAAGKPAPFHRKFLGLVDRIEREFPVTRWYCGDVPIWPLARLELHLDMHFASMRAARPALHRFPWRSLARAALPVRNLWRSRRDLDHLLLRPRRCDAIVLGNGVSLDLIAGAYRDRFAEPIIRSLEEQGKKTLLVQSGELQRLPWHRATYPANIIASRGVDLSAAEIQDADLPDHGAVLDFLASQDVAAASLERAALQKLAARVAGTASSFERLLEAVRPSLAFVVTYYGGLGPAFVLACRRRRILTVDLQHCPQEGAHKAYCFSALPPGGYDVLPDVFWNWTAREAEQIRRWAALAEPGRHVAVHGGHSQISALLDDDGGLAKSWHEEFAAAAGNVQYEQEILVALQPLGGHRETWQALRASIDAAPPSWRWWIRRHPATGPGQDAEYASLLETCRNPVVLEPASRLPLPALLAHMTALVSLASGAAAEAAAFGVPAFFLDESAHDTFAELIGCGAARVIDPPALNEVLAANVGGGGRMPPRAPALTATLKHLQELAQAHSKLPGCFQPYNYTRPDRYPWLFEFASRQLGSDRPHRLLSFGCSRGDEVFSLQRYFPLAAIRGVDVDPRNIAYCVERAARRNCAAATFATAASTHDEPDACYDAIFCLAVLCCGDLTVSGAGSSAPRLYFADFERVVSDFVRCLKPGGLLLLHTANFRFSDTSAYARCEVLLEATPQQMAPDLLYGRDNQLLQGEQYRAVAFRKKH
jgi:SAM-dependent methyltransferase